MRGNFRDSNKSGTISRNISYSEDHALEMLFTRKKARAGANPESPPITPTEKNIREVHTISRTVFKQEHNELFVQQFVQYSQ